MRAPFVTVVSRAGGRSLGLLGLGVALIFTTSARGSESPPGFNRVIPPGQEELLAALVGRGVSLPGACRFAVGKAESAVVTAEYACGDGRVVLELRRRDDAPPAAPHTDQFALVVRRGSPPAGLVEAVAALTRAHEGSFHWKLLPASPQRVATRASGAAACGIVIIGLAIQYLVGRRLATPQRDAGPHDPSAIQPARSPENAGGIPLLLGGGVVAAYLVSRLVFLTGLPVFVDESIHVLWARGPFGRDFAAQWSVGRWLPIQIMSLYTLLPFDPLLCARLASVSMGLATLLACMRINRELFSPTAGVLAGAVYAMLPFALLYDRLALADIYLTAFAAWTVFGAVSMTKRRGAIYPLVLGLCAYAAILSKPTGGLFLATPILAVVLLVQRHQRAAYLMRSLPTMVGGAVLLAFLLYAGYGTSLVTSQADVSKLAQLTLFGSNLETARHWLTSLLTPFMACSTVVVVIVCTALGTFGRARAETFLVMLLLLAALPFLLVSATWYPSYLLFTVVPVALLLSRAIVACVSAAARAAHRVDARLVAPTRGVLLGVITLLLVGVSAPPLLALMTQPEDAGLPPAESTRFISGWGSGYGLKELAKFLDDQAHQGALNIVRFDFAGPPNQGMDVYLTPTESTHLYTIEHLDENAAAQIAQLASVRRTLFISNPEGEAMQGAAARASLGGAARIWRYVRPGAQSTLEVWEVPHP